MTDRRKLQAEIDRVIKKVQEGTDDFEECLEKFNQNSNNPTQKEKYENDLKKEIKKLQRLRDQLKTWIQNSDIKDKTPLIDHRKAIESLMERFKVVERETKTKAYSKEGLQAAEKRDLELEEKENLTDWINTQLVEFNRQIDVIESELESLQVNNRKKKTAKDDRIGRLTALIERHRYHVHRLEMILRAVDNKAIAPEVLTKTQVIEEEDLRLDVLETLSSRDEDDDGDTAQDDEDRIVTFCMFIEYYLKRCNDDNFREVPDLYEQLDLEQYVDFDLPTPVSTQAGASGTATTTTTTNPSQTSTNLSNSVAPISASTTNSVPQPSVITSTTNASGSDDKDPDRDSRERERDREQGTHLSSTSEDHSQDDSRKRHKSEEKNAQRSKANQQSSSSSSTSGTQPHLTAEKSPSAPTKNSTPATTSVPIPANTSQQTDVVAAVRVPTPPSSIPTTLATTPRSNASARGAPNSYAKSVAGAHADSAGEQPTLNVQLPQPLSYSTVVSSPGISYAAVAAITSASQPQPTAGSNSAATYITAPTGGSTSQGSTNATHTAQTTSSTAQSAAGGTQQVPGQGLQSQSAAANLFQSNNLPQSASQMQQASTTSTFPSSAASNNVPPTTPSPQPPGAQQAGPFSAQQFASQQSSSNAYPLSGSPFVSGATQPVSQGESQLNTPATLASQAHAAALQNNTTAELLALREQSNQQQLAAASMQMTRVSSASGGMNVQTGLPAPQGASVSPVGASDLTGGAFGVAANAAAPFGGLGASSSFGGAPAPSGPQSQAVAQQTQSQAAQSKVVVQVNPVLGITPFGLKEMQQAALEQHDLVERARKHMPIPTDSERARICLPRLPVVTPAYYPQQVPPAIDTLDFFSRQQPETLFFVFYYMEGTRAQLLAARALKLLQWRYHSKYLMWFQRLTEPTHITDEQETGTYIYFDYERWQTKRKEQFTFEYRFLEDKTF